MPALYYLQSLFTIWMLVDCIRNRREAYWYLIAFVPFGPVVYFFAVKLDDWDTRWLRRLFVRTPSVESLRYAARESPSFANRLRLAEALGEAGEFDEAAALFEQLLHGDPRDRASLHGLGICLANRGEAESAVEVLAKLVEQDMAFRDYAAALDLATALQAAGRPADAVDLLEAVVRRSGVLAHRVALATTLMEAGRPQDARAVLSRGLEDTRHAPSYIRRRDRRAAREAAALLAKVGKEPAPAGE